MLLRDYLLLDLGRTTAAEAGAWQADMVRRRQVDACRDLLGFWHSREGDGAHLCAYPVARLTRFKHAVPLDAFTAGLLDAAQEALQVVLHVESKRGGDSLEAGGHPVCTVSAELHGDVAAGRLVLELAAVQQAVGPEPEIDVKVLTNAVAYHFEQIFGYAQAAKHPVAYEESLRPEQ